MRRSLKRLSNPSILVRRLSQADVHATLGIDGGGEEEVKRAANSRIAELKQLLAEGRMGPSAVRRAARTPMQPACRRLRRLCRAQFDAEFCKLWGTIKGGIDHGDSSGPITQMPAAAAVAALVGVRKQPQAELLEF